MKFTLVKGDPARLEEYVEIFRDSKLYDAYFSDSDRLPTYLLDAIKKDKLFIALSSQDEPIGALCMSMDGMADLPYLHLLGVKKKFRGMGIGTDLIRIFIATAEAYGAPNMFIMTSKFNVRAKQLYQAMGFTAYCLLPSPLRPGIDEYVMMRPAKR